MAVYAFKARGEDGDILTGTYDNVENVSALREELYDF